VTAILVFSLVVLSVIADGMSTIVALAKGAAESNPLQRETKNFRGFVTPAVKPVLILAVVLISLRPFLETSWGKETYLGVMFVALAIALGKFHAAAENLSLAYLDFSPSNELRNILSVREGWLHALFNGLYFGLPWALFVNFFVKFKL